jgi:hypothetical protein
VISSQKKNHKTQRFNNLMLKDVVEKKIQKKTSKKKLKSIQITLLTHHVRYEITIKKNMFF